jgi:hypothetical protein
LGTAASDAAWSATHGDEATHWNVYVLERLDAGAIREGLKGYVIGDSATPAQKLYLWGPLAEALEPADVDFAAEALAALPGDVFPLLRLSVLHRLRHRWQDCLAESQKARLTDLIAAAEADLKAHFMLFAEKPKAEVGETET